MDVYSYHLVRDIVRSARNHCEIVWEHLSVRERAELAAELERALRAVRGNPPAATTTDEKSAI